MQNRGTGMRQPMAGKRKTRYRVKGRFFIFLALFVAVIVGIGFGISALVGLLAGPGDTLVTLGMLEDEKKLSAILLRDEQIVSKDNYVSISYSASENQNVKAGDEILDIYEIGYTQTLIQNLEQIRQSIMSYQQENILKNIINEDLQEYDNRIQEKSAAIRAVTRGEEKAKLVDLERELRNLMSTRQDYLKRTQAVMEDSQLSRLYEQEKQEVEKINAYRNTLTSPRDGRVSFYFDGYEHFLNIDSLPDITASKAQELIRSTSAPATSNSTIPTKNLFRTVDPNRWYTLLVTKDWGIAVGQTCELRFSGYEDMIFTAEVTNIENEDGRELVVLEIREDIGPLLNTRHVTAVIGGRIEGMVVPLSALKENNGRRGVYLSDGQTFVPVNVVGKDFRDALVMPENEGDLVPGVTRVKTK